ncbi:hypothetical protein [Nibribacter koreensis]|uniref:Uncharacterized protein n=1 Tax=Nibribacter koreensis TaxID=1084519 RepID=A0ABP8FB68_9BACT
MTQDFLSNEAQVRSLAYDGQRVDLFRRLKDNKTLFTRMEYAKTVLVISSLSRDKYKAVEASIEKQIEERTRAGVDHSSTYK